MAMMSEFKEFALKGNVMDLAVGVIIGAAFGGVTKSMVDDVMMPPLGLAMGAVDFKDQYIPLIVHQEARDRYDELKADLLKAMKERVDAQNVEIAKTNATASEKDKKPLLPAPTSVSPALDQVIAKGIPTLRYGLFINTVINFIFVAFGVFLIVKLMATMQRTKPAVPPEPTASEKLLAEIRDTLKSQKAR
jgi:large conductance mechanosensitive channel